MQPSPWVLFLKRSFDVSIGIFGTSIFLLAWPFLALIIRLDSKGAALYRQERIGRNIRISRKLKGDALSPELPARAADVGGKPFTLWKFRTMFTDAEKAGPALARINGDSRITRVGWWLRATHLDELPQFWNILKGDMSFIGPRPERAHFTTQFRDSIPHYENRTLFLRPGLTGLAQICLGYDEGHESVVRKSYYDYAYRASLAHVRSYLKMELWILWNTAFYLLKPLRREGDVRKLDSLERVAGLGLHARHPEKESEHKVTAFLQVEGDDHAVTLIGQDAREIGARLDRMRGKGFKALDVSYSPSAHFDLEDLGFLVELSQSVNRLDGRVVVKNANSRVARMLRETHMDKVVEVERATPVLNFLTVDVECWFHAYNVKDVAPPSRWHQLESRVVENVERILSLLRAHDASATFFVLGWVADHYPEVVRLIASEGHEIGTHGYYHRLITDMTPSSFEEDLDKSLEAIAKHCSVPVIGHRASNFSVLPQTFWALEKLAKRGFVYDSSIFPIRRDRYGIPDYPSKLPHTLLLPGGKSLKEFPLSTLGVGKKFLPMAGGGYLRLFPHQVTEGFIANKNAQGKPVMVYFHPWELDTRQERLSLNWRKAFPHYVNLHTTEWKLNRLLQRYRFTGIRKAMENRRVRGLLQKDTVRILTHGAEKISLPGDPLPDQQAA